MTIGYEKWSNYTIGEIPWVNKNATHPHREVFIQDVIKNHDSVIEVGPGELLECQRIAQRKKVDYGVIDVSELFLENCNKNFPDVKTYCSPVEDISQKKVGGYKRDIVYAASVIEHLKDVDQAIKNMLSIARHFHFVMFKWNYKGKQLVPHYHPQREYWTSVFNIKLVLDVIRQYGHIEYTQLIKKKTGKRINFSDYHPLSSKRTHRTGDYMMIHGTCK